MIAIRIILLIILLIYLTYQAVNDFKSKTVNKFVNTIFLCISAVLFLTWQIRIKSFDIYSILTILILCIAYLFKVYSSGDVKGLIIVYIFSINIFESFNYVTFVLYLLITILMMLIVVRPLRYLAYKDAGKKMIPMFPAMLFSYILLMFM